MSRCEQARALAGGLALVNRCFVAPGLEPVAGCRQHASMPDNRSDPPNHPPPLSREERLAAKLRENLRRRKLQARELADDPGALPKSPGKS
jgi:hypothetical protein